MIAVVLGLALAAVSIVGWSELAANRVAFVGKGLGQWVPEVVLGFGLLITAAITITLQLANTVRHRARDLAEANRRLAAETEQRRVAAESAQLERRRLHDVLDGLPAYVILLSPDYQVPFANRYFEERFGKAEGRRCYEYLFQRTSACENCESFKVFETHAPHHWEWTGPDGRNYDIHDVPFTDTDGTPLILESGIDISERKAAEAKLAQVNRALRLVSVCNQALAHASSESEILQKICDLAVDMAGYRLVWIGFAEQDAGNTVRAAAKAGGAVAYVQEGFITWADEPRGRGPTGTAIRTGRPALCRDTLSEASFLPWRERALEFGFRSTLVVPLLRNGAAFGSISIYADMPDAFNEDEIALFQQLADDVAFAIGALRMRAEREAAEQKLRFLASAVESSDDAIYTKSLDGQIRSWNRGAERLYGYSREEAIGKDVRVLSPPDRPDEIKGLLAKLGRGESVDHFETVRRRKCGTLLDVSVTLSPIRDEGGAIVGASSIARNISERRRAEEALRASERKFRTLVENLPQRIAIKDRNSTYLLCNEKYAEELGIRRDEISGKTDFDFYAAELAEKYRADDARVMDSGELIDVEESYVAGGIQLDVQTVKVPLRGPDGTVNGVLVVFWDIGARKRAERELARYAEELKRSNEELQEFAFVASHDLQEPLRKVTAFSERLRDRCESQLDEVSQDYLHRMHNAALRMANLINSLLEYSRLATRALPFEEVDLATTCAGVVADLEQRIRETGARVTVHSLPHVLGDAVQLRQLVQNLLANALKFQAPGARPEISVFSLCLADRCEVCVADNGIGFDPEFTERIFRPFQRLHGRNEYEGSGMGLAICRKIAQRHGATIRVDTQPGKGSTFTVSFPAIDRNTGVSQVAEAAGVRGQVSGVTA